MPDMRSILVLFAAVPLAFGCSSNGGGNQGGGGSTTTSSTSTSSGLPGCLDASTCAAGEYCAWFNEACHIRTGGAREDQPGVCSPREENCTDAGAAGPVCGCDGKTYPDRCAANMAGVDIQNEGGCPPPAGTFGCGYQFCDVATAWCMGWLGDGNDSGPDHYTCTQLPAGCSPATCDCLPVAPSSGCTCTVTPEGGVVRACPAI